jgi:Ca-activated chloride channel family protein
MFKALRVFPAIMGLVMILVAGLPTVFQQQPVPTQPPIIIEPPIIIDPPPRPIGGVFTNPEWMSIDHHRVTITVDNQIATTNVDMQFTNNGSGFVEGTFLFPLPDEAAVDNLVMYINGQAIEARILRADEARAVYDEIVRQYRDPALLEYVGRNTIQANVFPIPPGESRRIELGYTQILEADNGLIKLTYPMANSATKGRTVNSMSLSVNVTSADAISNIYSPSHNVAISRD